MSWKQELDDLKKLCNAREARELNPAVREWFDFNRAQDQSASAIVEMQAIKERIRMATDGGLEMPEWCYHTDAYGWRLMMQPYTRDGIFYYLLNVTRPTKPTPKDAQQLERFIRHLGGDPDEHWLMTIRGPDDPDFQSFWTWPRAVVGQAS